MVANAWGTVVGMNPIIKRTIISMIRIIHSEPVTKVDDGKLKSFIFSVTIITIIKA